MELIVAPRASVIALLIGVDPFVIVISIASPAAKMGEVVFVTDPVLVLSNGEGKTIVPAELLFLGHVSMEQGPMIALREIVFVKLVGLGLCVIVRQLAIQPVKTVAPAIAENASVPLDGLDHPIAVVRLQYRERVSRELDHIIVQRGIVFVRLVGLGRCVIVILFAQMDVQGMVFASAMEPVNAMRITPEAQIVLASIL